jgi:hypothetical protein
MTADGEVLAGTGAAMRGVPALVGAAASAGTIGSGAGTAAGFVRPCIVRVRPRIVPLGIVPPGIVLPGIVLPGIIPQAADIDPPAADIVPAEAAADIVPAAAVAIVPAAAAAVIAPVEAAADRGASERPS